MADSGRKISTWHKAPLLPDWHHALQSYDINHHSWWSPPLTFHIFVLTNLLKIWSSSSSGLMIIMMTWKFLPPCICMDDFMDFHVVTWRRFLSHGDGIFLPCSYMVMNFWCQILMSFGWSNCSLKKDGESFISDLKTSIFRHTDVPNRIFHFSYVY